MHVSIRGLSVSVGFATVAVRRPALDGRRSERSRSTGRSSGSPARRSRPPTGRRRRDGLPGATP